MDETDRQLLAELAQNARLPVATLARKLGMARSTVQARLDRMEQDGTIEGYALRLGNRARADQIRATVLLMLAPQATGAVLARLARLPAVTTAHTASGRADLVLSLAAPTTEALDRTLDEIGAIDGVKGSETLIHLSTKINRST